MEINRLKAKALREQREAEDGKRGAGQATGLSKGQKRNFDTYVATPSSNRDARGGPSSTTTTREGSVAESNKIQNRPLDTIQPARGFAKYVEYDFSKMTDTKGGFLTQEDDPHNKILHAEELDGKPANMTLKEWERQQLLRSLRNQKAGPFEPGISLAVQDFEDAEDKQTPKCRECGSLEIDWKWAEVFHCNVCNTCKEKYPEKYSLLTKTEAREDYLLTDPELRDEDLLPHLERPNPHKSTYHNMMLYLRYQVEEYAFSERKWGSAESLDQEFERREVEKKKRKEAKFKSKLNELKKKTRVEAYRRSRLAGEAGAGGTFGDDLRREKNHVHDWGRPVVDPESGMSVKKCSGCGMEIEELEF
ncbi:putative dna repair protein rad14 [Phaeomoniella chlamydospora]|uniref:DNA repair protein RAD14 n=1 Tax=Phaeomoniella chlamydospora TaxID=158046 RepID=A0A0G2FVH6_PHACM|nr:putative dna repair protein rad14 [Phaeomoniella chlamydospora]